MSVREFVDEHYRHFNAGELAKTARSLSEFIDAGGSLMVTLAGAMSTAEIGRSLAPAIRKGVVKAVTCTGANLEEDLFNLVAYSHYTEIDDWRSLSAEQETQLENRITNRTIPEEEAVRKQEAAARREEGATRRQEEALRNIFRLSMDSVRPRSRPGSL